MKTDNTNSNQFEKIITNPQIIEKIKELNFVKPTKVQNDAIPQINEGKDAIITSKTGSGKTLVFLQHLLNITKPNSGVQGLVLLPTNELCRQVYEEFLKFNYDEKIKILELSSQKSMKSQIEKLDDANILIGTTGRIVDLQTKTNCSIDTIVL